VSPVFVKLEFSCSWT